MMISVDIDVSKDKHDCFIVSAEGEVLADVFTVPNNMDGFHCLLQCSCTVKKQATENNR
ncbi:MAG: IS110 family transposase [Acutalibacter sp.]